MKRLLQVALVADVVAVGIGVVTQGYELYQRATRKNHKIEIEWVKLKYGFVHMRYISDGKLEIAFTDNEGNWRSYPARQYYDDLYAEELWAAYDKYIHEKGDCLEEGFFEP